MTIYSKALFAALAGTAMAASAAAAVIVTYDGPVEVDGCRENLDAAGNVVSATVLISDGNGAFVAGDTYTGATCAPGLADGGSVISAVPMKEQIATDPATQKANGFNSSRSNRTQVVKDKAKEKKD
ncbi:MAG: hypothetical protein AAGF20_02370 [Pseudomonadota bacterium]